jgi:hypothetical protein
MDLPERKTAKRRKAEAKMPWPKSLPGCVQAVETTLHAAAAQFARANPTAVRIADSRTALWDESGPSPTMTKPGKTQTGKRRRK